MPAQTPVFGLPYEDSGDQPGISLTGGEFGTEDILAEETEAALLLVRQEFQNDIDALEVDVAELQGRFAGFARDLDGLSTASTTSVYTGTSLTIPSAQNPVGARFEIIATCHLSSSVDDDLGEFAIRRGTAPADPYVAAARQHNLRGSGNVVTCFTVDDPPPGDVIYGMFIRRVSGTGTVTMSGTAEFEARMSVKFFDMNGT